MDAVFFEIISLARNGTFQPAPWAIDVIKRDAGEFAVVAQVALDGHSALIGRVDVCHDLLCQLVYPFRQHTGEL